MSKEVRIDWNRVPEGTSIKVLDKRFEDKEVWMDVLFYKFENVDDYPILARHTEKPIFRAFKNARIENPKPEWLLK